MLTRDEWDAAARERGFQFYHQGPYHILDVHWHDDVRPPREIDPVTGLPMRVPFQEQIDRLLETPVPVATMIQLVLTGLDSNPGRDYQPWLEALPQVAEILRDFISDGDPLGHLYTPREFALVRVGLAAHDAEAELERLRERLIEGLAPLRVRGRLSSASWPEVASPEQIRDDDGWDYLWEKLRDESQSLAI